MNGPARQIEASRDQRGSSRRLRALAALGALVVFWLRLKSRQAADTRPRWSPLLPLANLVGWRVGWHRLPWPFGLAMVVALRHQLRRDNLHDPSRVVPSLPQPPLTTPESVQLKQRSADGTFTDLSEPGMGSAGTRFGRNVPILSVTRAAED